MKLHLAFCPAIVPRPPLGMASLKGYVEAHGNHQITCFDLNLTWHQHLISQRQEQPQLATMAEAVEFFTAANDDYFQQVPFNQHASRFYLTAMAAHEALVKGAEGWLQGQPHPAWMTTMAHTLLAGNPQAVGFSVCYASQVAFSLALARLVKSLAPKVVILFGGSLTTTDAHLDPFLDHGDYVVINEGEKPLLALLNALQAEEDPQFLPGVVCRRQGAVSKNGSENGIRLDAQPMPDFSDLDINGYFTPTPVIPILTSRGCFWRRCSFCVHHEIYSDAYRVAPIARVVDEMAAWVERGVYCFSIADEMLPAKRYLLIAKEILRRGLKIYWFGLARPSHHFNQETMNTLYAAGCRFLLWGVESGCQRILDLIDKGTTKESIAATLNYSAAAGIKNYIFMIVGFPSETSQEYLETLSFLYALRESIHNVMSGPFKLEPNSKIAADPQRFAIDRHWPDEKEAGNLHYSVVSGLPPAHLKGLHELVKTHFYNSFSLFSTWFGLLREHALYYHANPRQQPTFYWKWRIADPLDTNWQASIGLEKYLQDVGPHPATHLQAGVATPEGVVGG
ncbi:MAG: radical SAM protein [Magnetococcales bacterium]|nr:radical SAM protein [Magnetococcales bacterium]